MSKHKMVTGVFRDRVNAQAAYDILRSRGYTDSEINVLMSDKTRATYFTTESEGRNKAGSMGAEGTAVGGTVGTAIGAGLAALLAVGTSLVIPGLGLVVAGPIAAALAGGGAGAVAGGLVGGLIGLGIPEDNAQAYHDALREGGVVIGVVPHENDEVSDLEKDFENLGGENIIYTA